MLAELLESMRRMIRDADGLKVVQVAGVERDAWIHYAGTQLEKIELPPPLRKHRICTLDDVYSISEDKEMAKEPEIFFDFDTIQVVLDRNDRREVATLSLLPTDRYTSLVKMSGEPLSCTVNEAVRLLRFELHGVGADHVVQALKRVDFSRTSRGTAVTEHGKESLGKSVEATIQATDEIPETVDLTVPLYSNPGVSDFTATITVGIYLDVDTQRVAFRPLADEIMKAQNAVMSQLFQALRDRLPRVPKINGAL